MDEKLFTLTLDGTANARTYCFTPTRDYAYSTSVPHVENVLLHLNLTPISGTLCSRCEQAP